MMNVPIHILTMGALRDASVRLWPFPHVFVRDIFSSAFYNILYNALDGVEKDFIPLNETGRVTRNYSDQRFVRRSLGEVHDALTQILSLPVLGEQLLAKFFVTGIQNLHDEILVIRDFPGYSLGPHTDSPSKVISCLFYLARDDARPWLGTTFYVPKDRARTCPGCLHHAVTEFDRVFTFDYVPNAMLAFVKSDVSFHGVEPFTEGQRNLLLYDIRRK